MPWEINRKINMHKISTLNITEPGCVFALEVAAAQSAELRNGPRPAVCPCARSTGSLYQSQGKKNIYFLPLFLLQFFTFCPLLLPPAPRELARAPHTGRGEGQSLVCFEGCWEGSSSPKFPSADMTEIPKALFSGGVTQAVISYWNTCELVNNFSFYQACESRFLPPSPVSPTLSFPFPLHHVIFIWRFWNFARKDIWCKVEWPLTLERRHNRHSGEFKTEEEEGVHWRLCLPREMMT